MSDANTPSSEDTQPDETIEQNQSNGNSDANTGANSGDTQPEAAAPETGATGNADIDLSSDTDDTKSIQDAEHDDSTDLKNQLLRALADVENMRKRSERDVAQARRYGHLSFARDLLSCFDNLSQAVALAPEDKDQFDENLKNVLVGVEMISKEIETILERHHIIKLAPMGEKFDYNHHQAMFEVPNNELDAGTIVQVAQPGYLLHDRLIRPAMVGVSKKESEPKDSGPNDGKDTGSIDKQA